MTFKPGRRPKFAYNALLAASTLLSGIAFSASAEEVSLYTTREPRLIKPLPDEFTKDTGGEVSTLVGRDGQIERLKAECDKSPADVLMTVDIGNMLDLVEAGVTQLIDTKFLRHAIPETLRRADNQWYTLSLRDRVAYVAADM